MRFLDHAQISQAPYQPLNSGKLKVSPEIIRRSSASTSPLPSALQASSHCSVHFTEEYRRILTYTMAPTPESAAFLAKKPTVPPTFDGVDYDDTARLKQAQDAIIREQWVRSMMARLVREEMGKCYYREGVNHLEKCGPLRGMHDRLFR